MRILVTGATGYIGARVANAFVADGHDVAVLLRSSSDPSANKLQIAAMTPIPLDGDAGTLASDMARFEPDAVVHLASQVLVRHTAGQLAELIDSNVTVPTRLLEAMLTSGATRFVNVGTYWQHYEDAAYNPVNLYAATKQAFEDILLYYVKAHGYAATSLHLFDVYGPGDKRPKVFDLLRRAARSGEALRMSPGGQMLNFVHVDDVVEAFRSALASSPPSGSLSVYGVGGRETMSLRETVDLYRRVVESPVQVEWGALPYRPREVMVPWNRFTPLPGWEPKVSLEDGIRRMESDPEIEGLLARETLASETSASETSASETAADMAVGVDLVDEEALAEFALSVDRRSLASSTDEAGQLDFAPNNLLLHSGTPGRAGWSAGRVTLSAGEGPLPGSGSVLLAEDGQNGLHYVSQGARFEKDLRYVFSAYAKAEGGRYLALVLPTAAFGGAGSQNSATFDVTAGTLAHGDPDAARIEGVGEGWMRCSIAKPALIDAEGPIAVHLTRTGQFSTAGHHEPDPHRRGVWLACTQLEATTYRDAPSRYRETIDRPVHGPRFVVRSDRRRCLLLEPEAKNLLNFSETFARTGGASHHWTDANVIRLDADPRAPDGTRRALAFLARADAATIMASKPIGAVGSRVFSIWLRRICGSGSVACTTNGGRDWVTLEIDFEWRRYRLPASTCDHRVGLRLGAMWDCVAAWGAQLEDGVCATSYIRSGARAGVRASEALSASAKDGDTFAIHSRTLGGGVQACTTLAGAPLTFPESVMAMRAERQRPSDPHA